MNEFLTKFISPSRVDEFLQYQSGVDYFGNTYTADMFITKLLRLEPPDAYLRMEAGSAVHYFVEMADLATLAKQKLSISFYKRWCIELNNIPPFVANFIDYPKKLCREVKVKGEIAGIMLRGTVDAINSNTVYDVKTYTTKTKVYTYADSMQWRIYLLLTGLEHFIYKFVGVDVDTENRKVTLTGKYDQWTCHAYPEMRKDVEKAVWDYYCHLEALEPHIKTRLSLIAPIF